MTGKQKLAIPNSWVKSVLAFTMFGITASLTVGCKNEQLTSTQGADSKGSTKNETSPGPVQKSAMTVYSVNRPEKRNTVLASNLVQIVFERLQARQLIRVKMMPKFEYRLDILFAGKAESWEISDSGFARQLNVKDTNIYRIENFDEIWEMLNP